MRRARSGAAEVEVFSVPADSTLADAAIDDLQRALDLYAHARDKTWGLVDCATFIVMRDRGLTTALTADRHFEQAGFQVLMRHSKK